jgi:hypothetical protein
MQVVDQGMENQNQEEEAAQTHRTPAYLGEEVEEHLASPS